MARDLHPGGPEEIDESTPISDRPAAGAVENLQGRSAIMNKWLTGIALVGSMALTAPAHAFLFDGFGDDQDEVEASSNDTPQSSGPESIDDTDLSNAVRELSVGQKGGPNDDDGGAVRLEVARDALLYSQDTTTFGEGVVDWDFDQEAFASPVRILLNVAEVDGDDASATFSLERPSVNQPVEETLTLPEVDGEDDDPRSIVFQIDGFSAGETFDSASLTIDGSSASGLDMSANFIEVPAPGILGLLGAGLVGMAFATRRRG